MLCLLSPHYNHTIRRPYCIFFTEFSNVFFENHFKLLSTQAKMEFVTSQKSKQTIIRDGYVYTFQKELANDFSSYECELRRKGQCKARIKLDLLDECGRSQCSHSSAFAGKS